MSVSRRAWLIFKSRSKKTPVSLESIEEDLTYFYHRQLEELAKRRSVSADRATTRRRVELQLNNLQNQRRKLEDQGRKAHEIERDDLANEVTQRLVALDENIQTVDKQYAKASELEAEDSRQSQALTSCVDSFLTYKQIIVADLNSAARNATMPDSLNPISRHGLKTDDDDHFLRAGQLLDLLSPDVIYTSESHDESQ
jgi:phage shock protein A